MEAKAFIDQNLGRARVKKPASKTYRRMKASAERVFSRAKELLSLENVKARGLKPITIHIFQKKGKWLNVERYSTG